MAKEAVAWMEKHKDRPFYLNYWMFSVHAPFDAKKALIEKHRARVNPADPQRSPTYAAMVESMDDAVGTLLDALDRLKLADKTIIIFTSDNGGNMYNEIDGTTPTSNAPLRGGKATMFEGGTRVPCVIAWPGVTTAGSRSDAMIQSEDYYPTLLAGLGLQPAPGQRFDGISILPALEGRRPRPRAPCSSTSRTIPPCPTGCRPPSPCIAATGSSSASSTAARTARTAICSSTCATISARRTTSPRSSRNGCANSTRSSRSSSPTPKPWCPFRIPPSIRQSITPKTKASRSRDANAQAAKSASAAKADPGDHPADARLEDPRLHRGGQGRHRHDHRHRRRALPRLRPRQAGAGAKLRFRLKCDGGSGKVAWLPAANANPADAPKPVEFSVKAGAWAEISAAIPAPGDKAGIVRLFLPAQDASVELDWIELTSGGQTRRWDF